MRKLTVTVAEQDGTVVDVRDIVAPDVIASIDMRVAFNISSKSYNQEVFDALQRLVAFLNAVPHQDSAGIAGYISEAERVLARRNWLGEFNKEGKQNDS